METPNRRSNINKPIIGITLGDINGIGPEVVIKALSDSRILSHITPVIFGSTKVLSFYRKMLNNDDFHYSQIKSIKDIKKHFPEADIIPTPNQDATDCQKALDYLAIKQTKGWLLIGLFGGDIDHSLHNTSLFSKYSLLKGICYFV